MPSTYTLISSNVLGSSAASVTFSAIPSTYTDLVLRISARLDVGGVGNNASVAFNGLGTSIFSGTFIRGNGSAASSGRYTSGSSLSVRVPGTDATSNTFSSNEIYFPNYTGTTQKPISQFNVVETNATATDLFAWADLANLTTAITSITVTGSNFVSGSSFYLYGIKNS